MAHDSEKFMKDISMEAIDEISAGSFYSELNDAYEAVKEFGTAFWEGAKKGYGLE